MRRLQIVAEIGQMYADPYTRAVTRPQLHAIGMTWLNLFTTVIAFIACALPVVITMLWPETTAAALMKTPLFLVAVEGFALHAMFFLSLIPSSFCFQLSIFVVLSIYLDIGKLPSSPP